MKTNIYKVITNSINASVTGSVTTSVTSSKLPDNAWLVLAQFGTYKEGDRSRSFSVSELKRILRDNIHINTLRSMLRRLENNALIRVYTKRTGRTGTTWRYIITTDGMGLWEAYLREMQLNIGKVEI
jgi:hypothetical protein